MEQFDVVVRKGRVIDGAGNSWFKADVGIVGDTIKAVGELSRNEAGAEIDANGLIICPGFIDVHTHSDVSFLINPKADSKLTQGVTTEIVGNCGDSPAPITELGKKFSQKEYEDKEIECDWNTVAEYFQRLEARGLALNVGTLVGHGIVRASVMGYEARDPTTKELESMKKMVEDAMQDGAFGLSTGIKYAPGCYAKTNEIVELCKVVRKYRGIYATHVRNQGDHLIESIDEAIEIGRRSGTPVHISHLKSKGRRNWGKASNMLRIIDEAIKSDLDVTFDQYPYLAGSSNLDSCTPEWAREGGPESLMQRLKDPEQRKKIEEEIPQHEDWYGPDKTLIAGFRPNPSYEGKTLEEIAKIRNISPVAAVCDLLLEAHVLVPRVGFYGWEKDLREIMTHHAMMVGSDGSSLASYGVLGRGKPHPRNYGTFTRFLGEYVLKQNVMSLQDGIRRMTSFPAQRFGLTDRGLLRMNMRADAVVFDPREISDIATFANPHQYSKGIKYVIVNGKVAIDNEKLTGKLAGKILRHTT